MLVILSFLIMNNTSSSEAKEFKKEAKYEICEQFSLIGYINHAQISNSEDFEMQDRGKYSLDILTTSTATEHSKTSVTVDSGSQKQTIWLINSCSPTTVSSIELD